MIMNVIYAPSPQWSITPFWCIYYFSNVYKANGFPGDSVVKNLPANAEDTGLILGSGRSPWGRHGNPFQYSCLENPMERGACGLQSMGSQRVRCDLVYTHTYIYNHLYMWAVVFFCHRWLLNMVTWFFCFILLLFVCVCVFWGVGDMIAFYMI